MVCPADASSRTKVFALEAVARANFVNEDAVIGNWMVLRDDPHALQSGGDGLPQLEC